MSSNICGNCQNFKPRKGDKFFNCTAASHAGVKYGMQVRPDTRSCDAFLPSGPTPKPIPSPGPTLKPKPESQFRTNQSSQPKPAEQQKPKTLSTTKPDTAAKPKPAPKLPQEPSAEDVPRPTGLCAWGRLILVAALVLVIGLPAWGIYSCASKSTSTPLPTPAPMPANAVVKYFDIGGNTSAMGPDRTVAVLSAQETTSYSISSGETFKAPSGKFFMFIAVACNNVGNTSFLTGPAYFTLTDSAGHSYPDQTHTQYRFSKPYPNAALSPSIIVGGLILWVVPLSATGLEVSYLLDSASNPPVIARWKLTQ